MKKLTFLIAVICMFQNAFGQTFFETSLETYRNQTLPEKVFLHTDKEVYAAGENIWMAAYLLDGQTHKPGSFSNTIHVELRDELAGVIQHIKLFAESGNGAGSILIPSDIIPGSYALFAYTQYQLNGGLDLLFRKRIRIVKGLQLAVPDTVLVPSEAQPVPTIEPFVKLRFFPEGGDCLENMICKVAVVAENERGRGVNVNGLLIDSDGKKLSEIKTNKYGVGLINFIPKAGLKYFGMLSDSEVKFELQSALPMGYQLGVIHIKEKYRIIAKTNEENSLKGTRVTLNLRGIALLNHVIQEDLKTAILDIPETDLFSGVVTATLFDQKDEPMSERLFFVAPSEFESELIVETDKQSYALREQVNLDFSVPQLLANEDQKDSLARISYTVIPDQVLDGSESENIVTWLLLNSDLKERISINDSLLLAATRLDEKIVDDLMLTRGWRRFKWEAIPKRRKFVPEYLVERGVYVMGKMGIYENAKKARPGKVFLSNISTALAEERMTDEDGNFIFGPYVTFDTLQVLIQGRYKPGKKNRLNEKITKDDNEYVQLTLQPERHLNLGDRLQKYLSAPMSDSKFNYKDLSDRMLTISQSYDSLSIVLDVIDLKAKRIVKAQKEVENRTSLYSNTPDNRMVMDSISGSEAFTSVLDVLRMIPGIRISGSYGNENILIRGFNSITLSSVPAFFIDGMEVDLAFVRNYPMANVDFVDVIKGAKASIFGSRGANGVILLYTRSGNSDSAAGAPGQMWTEIEGYHKTREFPVFDPKVVGNQNRPDIRTTIFWNPLLFTDKIAEAQDEFTTSDQTGKFHVIAQGLTYDGRPVFGKTSFEVKR